MNKIIVTIVGKDRVGIVAAVCNYLAENSINILDINQTITSGYFNMMMIVDVVAMKKPFTEMQDELTKLGEGIGVRIQCQREEIFESMHRL
jgi:ACT domain-containing protein